jgi:hypothetical protein
MNKVKKYYNENGQNGDFQRPGRIAYQKIDKNWD